MAKNRKSTNHEGTNGAPDRQTVKELYDHLRDLGFEAPDKQYPGVQASDCEVTFSLVAAQPLEWQITIELPNGVSFRVWVPHDDVCDDTSSKVICTEDEEMRYALICAPQLESEPEHMDELQDHLKELIKRAEGLDTSQFDQPPGYYVDDAQGEFEQFWHEVPEAAILLRAHELQNEEGRLQSS